jgi:hypothetical protein
MNGFAQNQRLEWRRPVLSWIVILCGVAAVSCLGVAKPERIYPFVAMAMAAAMLLTLAFGFVGVRRNPPLLRLIGGAGFLFLSLMFALSFADLLTRLH